MQQPESANVSNQLSREQRWEVVRTLLQRTDIRNEAQQAFHAAYPNAPEAMMETAIFHTYIDGIGAAIDWLVDLELFLRNPSLEIHSTTYHLLYHLYNWQQFSALLPDGKAGVLDRLKEIKNLVSDGDTEAILATVEELESMLEGSRSYPDFHQ